MDERQWILGGSKTRWIYGTGNSRNLVRFAPCNLIRGFVGDSVGFLRAALAIKGKLIAKVSPASSDFMVIRMEA